MSVSSVIATLDFLDNFLHLLDLTIPLLLAHLTLTSEELIIWLFVAATEAVPEGGVLTVVVVEVQVVHGVASSTVNYRRVGDVLAVVDEDSPDIDEGEEGDVGELLKREDEWEDMVRKGLSIAVQWVESVRGIWSWHDPLVMWLVESLVDQWVVKTAVNQVDPEIGKDDEEWELEPIVPYSWSVGAVVIQHRVAAYFGDEEGSCEDGHDRQSSACLSDFHTHLVLEELGMIEGIFVEDENVREGCEDEVDDKAKDP